MVAGVLQLQILAAIARLGPNAYGKAIQESVETRHDRKLGDGQVYVVLAQLRDRGLIEPIESNVPTGGAPRVPYRLTETGERELQTATIGRSE